MTIKITMPRLNGLEKINGFYDKTGWPDGPWKTEPDRVQWTDEATGLPGLIRRNDFGVWCGYVGLPPSHPWYGQKYNAIEDKVDVYGGLTYSDHCDGNPETGICHVPEPGQPDHTYWIGFDCHHLFDYAPNFPQILNILRLSAPFADKLVYRDIEYGIREVQSLAAQVDQASARPTEN